MNIHSTEELILGNKCNAVHNTACNSGISVQKCWNNNPRTLTVQEIVSLVSLIDVNVQPDGAACCYVYQTSAPIWTGGKQWVYNFTAESKQSSMGWYHTGSPWPKKFKTQLSVGKSKVSVFWDSEVVSHVDFLPRVTTNNARYYSNLFCNNVH